MKYKYILLSSICLYDFSAVQTAMAQNDRTPNIIYIMSDDHASQAVSAYGGILSNILPTPNIDRIAHEGAILRNCFVTNSISTPSRGAIITGQYSQKNGVYTLQDPLDPDHPNVAKCLQQAGYQTAIFGKWHLHAEPTGFDYYNVLPGQGRYNDPMLIEKGTWGNDPHANPRTGKVYKGHSTDVIGSEAIKYMENRDKSKPFFMMCHFKAPHRPWTPAERFKDLLKDVTIPEPENLLDTYEGKGEYAELLRMSMEHLRQTDVKTDIPTDMSRDELRHWAYQLYIKDYLRCIAGIDENVGRILNYLDEQGLAENTVVIYTGDQGFFLGEHGWFDKRLMYEESFRTPLLIRLPGGKKGDIGEFVQNIDYGPTILDLAGIQIPSDMHGVSFLPLLRGEKVENWRKSLYYHFYEYPAEHSVKRHYGVRTERYKLIHFYNDIDKWELFDLQEDPMEMNNLYGKTGYENITHQLEKELIRLQKQYQDTNAMSFNKQLIHE